jgi:hypothetical protein
LVDHVADKVCAIFERHNGNPSTRFKDLIDLVAISRRATMNADLQKRALVTEAARRNLELPAAFEFPIAPSGSVAIAPRLAVQSAWRRLTWRKH